MDGRRRRSWLLELKIRQLLKPLALADCASATKRSSASSSRVYLRSRYTRAATLGIVPACFPGSLEFQPCCCVLLSSAGISGEKKNRKALLRLGEWRLELPPDWSQK